MRDWANEKNYYLSLPLGKHLARAGCASGKRDNAFGRNSMHLAQHNKYKP